MDERQARAAIIKQQRRSILDAMKLASPVALAFESLRHVLPEIEDDYLKRDLVYLEKKGLVEWTNRQPNLTWAKRMFELTGLGTEVADAINLDPALEP